MQCMCHESLCFAICFHYLRSCRMPASCYAYVFVYQSAFIRGVSRRQQSVDSKSFFFCFFSLCCSLTLNCILYISPVWLEFFCDILKEQLVSRSLSCASRMFHYSNHLLACCELCGIIAVECRHFAHRNRKPKKNILKSQLEKEFAGEKTAKHTLKRTQKCIFIDIAR